MKNDTKVTNRKFNALKKKPKRDRTNENSKEREQEH